jgi:hemerythrin-like domain-containing protein
MKTREDNATPLGVRRDVLRLFTVAGFGAVLPGSYSFGQKKAAKEEGEEEEVSPAEDLMREHGLLNRILLIYDESVRRMEQSQDLDPGILFGAARIIRTFVEDYHEKLEEDYLFPRFQKARMLNDLVAVLKQQHDAGRTLTGSILQLATPSTLKAAGEEKTRLIQQLKTFVRMYRPHEAREDTVLFPAIRKIVKRSEYDSLGEEFEDKEHKLFGENGFESMVDKVADLEKRLGTYDLAQFTPKV